MSQIYATTILQKAQTNRTAKGERVLSSLSAAIELVNWPHLLPVNLLFLSFLAILVILGLLGLLWLVLHRQESKETQTLYNNPQVSKKVALEQLLSFVTSQGLDKDNIYIKANLRMGEGDVIPITWAGNNLKRSLDDFGISNFEKEFLENLDYQQFESNQVAKYQLKYARDSLNRCLNNCKPLSEQDTSDFMVETNSRHFEEIRDESLTKQFPFKSVKVDFESRLN